MSYVVFNKDRTRYILNKDSNIPHVTFSGCHRYDTPPRVFSNYVSAKIFTWFVCGDCIVSKEIFDLIRSMRFNN
ncbi:hypothetical protein VP249E411_P0090 [Vibrio phage 249E41-1]|nr:hypothetical protein VP249E411_P0090 [Vibrio phage 249E41-1]